MTTDLDDESTLESLCGDCDEPATVSDSDGAAWCARHARGRGATFPDDESQEIAS